MTNERRREISVVDRQRRHRVGVAALRAFLRRLAAAMPGSAGEEGSVAVALVSDDAMRELNRRFRGESGPTDVLSFPAGETGGDGEAGHLGDIAIAVPTAYRQARAHGHSLARELRLLVTHGYLHLLGYDHERDDGEMLRLQGRLLGRLLPGAKGGRR